MQRYFVIQLTDRDLKERGQPMDDKRFEIQVLDSSGRAKACGYIGREGLELQIAGQEIPKAVLEAARRQPLGEGDYVDENGKSSGRGF